MNVDKYLETLGLSKKATRKEIRTAYQRLALIHHPDKNGGNKDGMFYEINESYNALMSILSMTSKDEIDASIHTEFQWGALFDMALNQIQTCLNSKLKKQRCRVPHIRRSKTLHATLNVSLEDIYNAKIKKLKVSILGWPHYKENMLHEVIYISLLNVKDYYMFKGKGDYITCDKRGDLCINVNIEKHPFFKYDARMWPNDLFVDYDMSLLEYYNRKFLAFSHLDGSVIDVEYDSGQIVSIVHGKGLPYIDDESDKTKRGDLYVFFKLSLPSIEKPMPDDLKLILTKYFGS